MSSGGETEPVEGAANNVPGQNANARPPEQHSVASPNPTVDDSKTPAAAAPKKAEAAPVHPAQAATQAPMKTTARPKPKSKRGRTKPRI